MITHLTKDGKSIVTGSGYNPPYQPHPGQVVGMPLQWVQIEGKWYRLDLYCDRVRRLYLDAIACIADFTQDEFREILRDIIEDWESIA